MSSNRAPVLVVDDERFYREAIRDALLECGFACATCEDGNVALNHVASQRFSVAIIDVRLSWPSAKQATSAHALPHGETSPGAGAIALIEALRIAQPDLQVIVLSSSADQELVLEALRCGAAEYLGKPLHDEELVLAVERAARVGDLAVDQRRLLARLGDLVERVEEYAQVVNRADASLRSAVIRDEAVRMVSRVLGAEKASLLLVDEDDAFLEVAATFGRDLKALQLGRVRVGDGVAGRGFEDSVPLLVADIRAEADFAPELVPDRYTTNSFVLAPISLPSRRFGLLCATDRSDGAAFDHEDLIVLRAIAVHVAEHLDRETNAESVAEMSPLDLAGELTDSTPTGRDPTAHDVEIARAICDAMSNEMDPASLVRQVLHAIEVAVDADPVSLYLIDSQTGELVLEGTGPRGLRLEKERLPVGRGLMEGVLVRGQLVAAPDPGLDPRFDASVDAPADEKPGALLAVPLKLRGKTVGVCRVHLPLGVTIAARTGELLAAALSAAVRNMLLYRSLLESIEEVAQVRRETRS